MIGRRKVLKAISFEKLKKRIRKNAKKGAYKNIVPKAPALKTTPPDSSIRLHDTVRIVQSIGLPPATTAILQADSLITLNEFLFETNSYKLKQEHFSELDVLSTFLLERPTLKLTISGHTDNTGNEHHNVNLSLRRAESVARYLINKGVLDDKIFLKGLAVLNL